jgi:hypothetical protein
LSDAGPQAALPLGSTVHPLAFLRDFFFVAIAVAVLFLSRLNQRDQSNELPALKRYASSIVARR